MRMVQQSLTVVCVCVLVLSGLGCRKKQSVVAAQNAPVTTKSYPQIADQIKVSPKTPSLKDALAKVHAHPSDATAQFRLGAAYFRDKRYSEAVDAFRAAMRLHPNVWQAYRYLGYSLMGCGRLDEAVEAFGHIPPLAKTSPAAVSQAYREIGNCQCDLDHNDLAEMAYRQSLAVDPSQGYVALMLGALEADKKKYDEAEAYFVRATRDTSDPEAQVSAHLYLGRLAAEQHNDLRKAEQEYALAVRLAPHNALAKERLDGVRAKMHGQ
jgi:tetratricopeptide (TPR) repeat protein